MNNSIPLIFIPGFLCNEALYLDLKSHLPSWVNYQYKAIPTKDSIEKIVNELIKGLPDKFIVCGLSMGGMICLELMKQAPERVVGLILMNTNAKSDSIDDKKRRQSLKISYENKPFYEVASKELLPKLIQTKNLSNAKLANRVIQMAMQTHQDTFDLHINALISRNDSTPILRKIQTPTLIIAGKEDQLCPISNHTFMHQNITDSQLFILQDCGHLSTMEQPCKTAKIITRWLEAKKEELYQKYR